MAFKPTQIVETEICSLCQGKGCSACGNFGMTAKLENQHLTFKLAPFLDLEARQQHQKAVLIRRIILVLIAGTLILSTWQIILK